MAVAPYPREERVGAPTGTNRFVYAISAATAVSGLLFGFDIAVINGALIALRSYFSLSSTQIEIAAGSLLLGCAFGAGVAGWFSDRFGRRRVIGAAALLFAASSIGAAIPVTLTQFIVARFIGGLGIGVASVLAPIYIAEVAPAGIRGRLVSFNQLAIVVGILCAYLVNWALSGLPVVGWRMMFAAALVPSIALALALIWTPESPRWLWRKGRPDEALAVLRHTVGEAHADAELAIIAGGLDEAEAGYRALLRAPYRARMTVAIALSILVQLSGVNAVLFYGSVILTDQVRGLGEQSAIGANVLLGVVNLLGTLIALRLIDRVGRKPLAITSAVTMAAAEVALGIAFRSNSPSALVVVPAMMMAIGAFAFGLGPCFWVILSEIFPSNVRGRATSVAVVVLWLATLGVTLSFLSLTETIGAAGTFWLYAAMCVAFGLVVAFGLPETKGRSLEDIERFWLMSGDRA